MGENGFINFYNWAIENGYTDVLTIDRINVNGNYTPENCRWVNNDIQANNKQTSIYVQIYGDTYTLAQVSNMFNIDYNVLWRAYYRGNIYTIIYNSIYPNNNGTLIKPFTYVDK